MGRHAGLLDPPRRSWFRPARPELAPAPAFLPDPGVGDAARAFAYQAIREADAVTWISGPGAVQDFLPAIGAAHPDLWRSGARWTGAGVLPGGGTWFAFDGRQRSAVVALDVVPRGGLLREEPAWPLGARIRPPWSSGDGLTEDLVALLEAAEPLSVWDLKPFRHLRPSAERTLFAVPGAGPLRAAS